MAQMFLIFSDEEIEKLRNGVLFSDYDEKQDLQTIYVNEHRYKQLVDEGYVEATDA